MTMDIRRFGRLLEKATEIGILKWTPTGDLVEKDGRTYRGYETKTGDFTIRTVVRQAQVDRTRFFGKIQYTDTFTVYAIEIEGKEKTLVLTSNPEGLRGEEVDLWTLLIIVQDIQYLIEEKDPIIAITKQLAKAFHELVSSI